jgi:hypothetical protein
MIGPGHPRLPALCACLLLVLACPKPPPVPHIESPAHGTFTQAASVNVSGHVTGGLGQVADVLVNGVSVLPLGPDGAFAASVALDADAIFNPIVAEVVRTNDSRVRDRITVIAGESVQDGDFSLMGVAMRLNDSGLDQVEPLVESLVDFDIAELLPVGTQVIDNECIGYDPLFGFCLGRVDVYVSSPAPGIGGFALDVDSFTNFVGGDIFIDDLRVDLFVDGVSGIAVDCGLRIDAATTSIIGDYGLSPDPVDPANIDVNQSGNVSVSFSQFDQEFTSGVCDFPLIGDLIQAIIGNVEPTVRTGLEDFLNDPDGTGPQDGPIADAIEVALAGIEIAGPIGQAIGVNLEAPLFDVFEDVQGITLDSDARITAMLPDPAAPDLLASWHVTEPFPSFGPTAPVSGLPYDLGLAISTSAFNQLLKAEIESGLLIGSITELDLGGGPIPLTGGFMAALVPQFSALDPTTPLRIDLAPTLAPIVTGADGPLGEQAEFRVSHLLVSIVTDDPTQTLLLEFAVDATLGLDVDFQNGELVFGLGTLLSQNLGVTILKNTLSADEPYLEGLLLTLLPPLFPSLADSLGTFPLPDFLGLQLDLVEVGKSGEYLSLFVNLNPVP